MSPSSSCLPPSRRLAAGAVSLSLLLLLPLVPPAARGGTAGEAAAASDPAAVALAEAVVRASGGERWPGVKTVRFTFQVEDLAKPGEPPLVSARHEWDVAGNRDTVTWAGKTVRVDLGAPNAEGDAKAAFARWTNDAYWLVAPLKLRDAGVHLATGGRQTVDGRECDVLMVSFDNGLGLTSNDHYTYYLDPQTHLPARWDYQPAPDKKLSADWVGYQQVGGLTLATDHPSFAGKRIRFLDVEVSP